MMKQRKWLTTGRAKENLKVSHGEPSKKQPPGTNQWMNALLQGLY